MVQITFMWGLFSLTTWQVYESINNNEAYQSKELLEGVSVNHVVIVLLASAERRLRGRGHCGRDCVQVLEGSAYFKSLFI